ncbi:MAG: glutaminyl-peptide cyclotransferase [Chitinophagaceae bacterium]|nr:glutaminyl-peptide cyclotransferase [Chitinophagaceae bacterium]
MKRLSLFNLYISLSMLMLSLACNTDTSTPENSTPVAEKAVEIPNINYQVTAYHAHDVNSFTEGLLVHQGKVYESTGAPEDMPNANSLFGELDLKTGKINVKATLDKKIYFGEGITFMNGKVYQLTYTNKKGFIYDDKTFKKVGEFNYANTEGWGLTNDSVNLIMTDGTSNITYLDPTSLQATKTIAVTEQGAPVQYLNEIEWINGYLYANIYTSNTIVKINPQDGKVVGKLDLTSLKQEANTKHPNSLETNGIAYDKEKDKIYVTGKFWPTVYEIAFSH